MKTLTDFIEWPSINTTIMTPHLAAWIGKAQRIMKMQDEALKIISDGRDDFDAQKADECLAEVNELIGGEE